MTKRKTVTHNRSKKKLTSKKTKKNASRAKVKKLKPNLVGPAANANWVNRSYCGTLDDMRNILEPWYASRRYEDKANINKDRIENGITQVILPLSVISVLRSLIEELQVYGNRMEAGLSDARGYAEMVKNTKQLKEEKKNLEKEIEKLRKKRDKKQGIKTLD
jgi:hypothetical protein